MRVLCGCRMSDLFRVICLLSTVTAFLCSTNIVQAGTPRHAVLPGGESIVYVEHGGNKIDVLLPGPSRIVYGRLNTTRRGASTCIRGTAYKNDHNTAYDISVCADRVWTAVARMFDAGRPLQWKSSSGYDTKRIRYIVSRNLFLDKLKQLGSLGRAQRYCRNSNQPELVAFWHVAPMRRGIKCCNASAKDKMSEMVSRVAGPDGDFKPPTCQGAQAAGASDDTDNQALRQFRTTEDRDISGSTIDFGDNTYFSGDIVDSETACAKLCLARSNCRGYSIRNNNLCTLYRTVNGLRPSGFGAYRFKAAVRQ